MHFTVFSLSLLLATATAVPAITQVERTNDRLLVQINLEQVAHAGDDRCEQLCDQAAVYCKEKCKNDECKAFCDYEDKFCKIDCPWQPPPSVPKNKDGSPYCVPTCVEGYYMCRHDIAFEPECVHQYSECRAKCDVEI